MKYLYEYFLVDRFILLLFGLIIFLGVVIYLENREKLEFLNEQASCISEHTDIKSLELLSIERRVEMAIYWGCTAGADNE